MRSYRANMVAAFEVLAEGLAPFLDEHMSLRYQDDWIMEVAGKLGRRSSTPVSNSDPQFQLDVMARFWGPVFASILDESARDTVKNLREARNEWAHFEGEVSVERAEEVCDWTRDLLLAIGSDSVKELSIVETDLHYAAARHRARESDGDLSTEEHMAAQFRSLRQERSELRGNLDELKSNLNSAEGRRRATAKQLAMLQQQYAKVAELSGRYEALRDQANEEGVASPESDSALDDLESEAEGLRHELAKARNPDGEMLVETPIGRRLLILFVTLLLSMSVLLFVLSTQVVAVGT